MKETFRNGILTISLIVGLVVGSLISFAAPAQAVSHTNVATQVHVPAKKLSKTKKANNKRSRAYYIAKTKYKGVRYKWGGTTRRGWDCSGFVTYVYRGAGVISKKSRFTSRSIKNSRKLKRTYHPKPGDIVVNHGGSHSGIYVGKNTMIAAQSPARGTRKGKIIGKRQYYTIRP